MAHICASTHSSRPRVFAQEVSFDKIEMLASIDEFLLRVFSSESGKRVASPVRTKSVRLVICPI